MTSLVTNTGNAKILAATPINPVTISKIFIGSGTGPFDANISSLKNKVWEGLSSGPQKLGAQISFTCHIPAEDGGWTITEWGLVDNVGDLIAYGQLDQPIYKPVGLMSLEPVFTIELGDSSQTELVVTDVLNFDHNFLNNRDHADSHPISAITGLQLELTGLNTDITAVQTDVDNKDAQNVKLAGEQTITGYKRFDANMAAPRIDSSDNTASVRLTTNNAALFTDNANVICDNNTAKVYIAGQLVGDGSGLLSATESHSGVAQIATQVETWAGVDDTVLLTPLKLRQFRDASAIGYGQAWVDRTGNITSGVSNTNNTNRPIQVCVYLEGANNNAIVNVTVGGVFLFSLANRDAAGQSKACAVIVPPAATYLIEGPFTRVTELR
ncbi:MAG: hypothetical protein [Caudoviricetes sp.]|nr:MAG: hypothetical protein [Caudoviricetes sp.]